MLYHRQACKTKGNALYGLLWINWGTSLYERTGECRKNLPYGWGVVKLLGFLRNLLDG